MLVADCECCHNRLIYHKLAHLCFGLRPYLTWSNLWLRDASIISFSFWGDIHLAIQNPNLRVYCMSAGMPPIPIRVATHVPRRVLRYTYNSKEIQSSPMKTHILYLYQEIFLFAWLCLSKGASLLFICTLFVAFLSQLKVIDVNHPRPRLNG